MSSGIIIRLTRRAQKEVEKCRESYRAADPCRAFLPAIVSTFGRIHCGWLRVLFLLALANKKVDSFFHDLGEQAHDSSEAICWHRSEFFWHLRANLGLACAQAATLCTQVVGHSNHCSARGVLHVAPSITQDSRAPALRHILLRLGLRLCVNVGFDAISMLSILVPCGAALK